MRSGWPYVLQFFSWLGSIRHAGIRSLVSNFHKNIGDLRDDLNDSWGAEPNRREADRVLDFLFGLQNPPPGQRPLSVVVLTGDIHTPGYSTLYSSDPAHMARPSIPHVVASPVSFQPFSWMAEAVYRRLTRVVTLGARGVYSAQVSHHFSHRNVVVTSLRNVAAEEWHLKVKYLPGGPPRAAHPAVRSQPQLGPRGHSLAPRRRTHAPGLKPGKNVEKNNVRHPCREPSFGSDYRVNARPTEGRPYRRSRP